MKTVHLTTLGILIIAAMFSSTFAEIPSPKQQLDQGVAPEEIVCKPEKSLILRESGIPACVTPATAEKMQLRGWTIIYLKAPSLENATQIDDEHADTPKAVLPQYPATTSQIDTIPASSNSIVNFYITDQDLNRAPNAAETVSTQGLFEFTINGVQIRGPDKMIETGFDTGKFFLRLQLPDDIDGRALQHDDVVLIKYLDKNDHAGDKSILTKSVVLSSVYAKIETSGGGTRIGHEFTIRIYEPDANTDSQDENKIPLSTLEYRGEGRIRTTLANPAFDANSGYLIETGPNTGVFEAKIKIPRELDGEIIHIGDWYEITYIDKSTPSGDEEIIFKGRIGSQIPDN